MGLLWRLFAPKPLKKARRTVSKASHTAHRNAAVTPRPVEQLQRAAHPAGLAELKIEDAAVNALRGQPRHQQSCHSAHPPMKAPVASKGNQDEQATPARTRGGETSAPVRDGIEDALLDGTDDLEVVGESYYQENLWRLVGSALA
jgi:hypothetical protein